MAKKVRRVKKKKKRSTPVAESSAGVSAEKVTEKTAAAKAKPPEDFHQEYAYVIKDLRRLLLLSGALFLLLIALNLLLR